MDASIQAANCYDLVNIASSYITWSTWWLAIKKIEYGGQFEKRFNSSFGQCQVSLFYMHVWLALQGNQLSWRKVWLQKIIMNLMCTCNLLMSISKNHWQITSRITIKDNYWLESLRVCTRWPFGFQSMSNSPKSVMVF